MTPEERKRAGRAVRERMLELGMNASDVQQLAPVDNKTLGAVIEGTRSANIKTLGKIERVLGWDPGEIERRGRAAGTTERREPLQDASELQLLTELLRRAVARQSGDQGAGLHVVDDELPAAAYSADGDDPQNGDE